MPDRTPRADDRGTTLVELVVVMIVLTLVAGLTAKVTVSIAQSVSATSSYADTVARTRLALGSIERQVRSGDVLFNPVAETSWNSSCSAFGTSAGNCMRVYTQVDGVRRCVQWEILADTSDPTTAVLKTRSFSPSWNLDGDVSAWRTVTRGLQLPSAAAPPFVLLGGTTPYSSRLLEVDLFAVDSKRPGHVTAIATSLAGRNATYGYTGSQCSPGPA